MKKNMAKVKAARKNFDENDDVPELDMQGAKRFVDHVNAAPKREVSVLLDPLVYSFSNPQKRVCRNEFRVF